MTAALTRAAATVSFLLWFTKQFLRANVVVLREVLTPGHTVVPAVVVVPLRSRSMLELSAVTSLMSLIPGSLPLTVGSGPHGPQMVVHGMHAADPDTLRAEVHELEDRMLACLRRDSRRRAVGRGAEYARHAGENGENGDDPGPGTGDTPGSSAAADRKASS